MIVEYDDFEVRYKAKESDQWKTVGIDELILNYADTRWIPVTERLPKETGYYLTSTEYNDVLHDFFFDGKWETAECFWYKVVAWMPLPEPYKGGDAECNQ